MLEDIEAAEPLEITFASVIATDGQVSDEARCRDLLEQDSGSLYFPSLCLRSIRQALRFIGPRERDISIGLVSLLLKSGADVNQRSEVEVHKYHDPPAERFQPSYTALEIAVTNTLPTLQTCFSSMAPKASYGS